MKRSRLTLYSISYLFSCFGQTSGPPNFSYSLIFSNTLICSIGITLKRDPRLHETKRELSSDKVNVDFARAVRIRCNKVRGVSLLEVAGRCRIWQSVMIEVMHYAAHQVNNVWYTCIFSPHSAETVFIQGNFWRCQQTFALVQVHSVGYKWREDDLQLTGLWGTSEVIENPHR